MQENEKFGSPREEETAVRLAGRLGKAAPPEVRRAFASGDTDEAAHRWARHLAERPLPKPLVALLPARRTPQRRHPLRWALTATVAVDPFISRHPDWEAWIHGAPGDDLKAWAQADLSELAGLGGQLEAGTPSDEIPDDEPLPLWLDGLEVPALRALVWAHVLPGAAPTLGLTWWSLLDTLVQLVHDATAIDTDRHPLAWQMLGGELGWTLAYLFPEIKACRALADPARENLTRGIDELLDGAGQPHADHFALLRPLLACWTRACLMGPHVPRGLWKKKTQVQYEWLVRGAIRLTRADGTAVLSPPLDLYDAWAPDLFHAAIHCDADSDDAKIAMVALPDRKKAEVQKIEALDLPAASCHSEWSETAVLRTNWTRSDPTLAVVYSKGVVRCELALRRHAFWSGPWSWSLQKDGRPVEPDGPWDEVCWVSDEDVDYLELEMSLTEGMRVQRHLLLAHNDEFVFLADAILGREPARLDYTSTLPISPELALGSPAETRELSVFSEKQQIRALPLALSEWRSSTDRGDLRHEPGRLTLSQTMTGCSLFAPWFIDFEPRRARKEKLTWRRLTVAESLRTLGDDEAVGYRVQIGRDQWLFYRAIAAPANRTVLGHNLTTEMLVARFYEDGSLEKLIEIGG